MMLFMILITTIVPVIDRTTALCTYNVSTLTVQLRDEIVNALNGGINTTSNMQGLRSAEVNSK